MSSGPNHRRGQKRRQDNGSTWEDGPPSSGCNSTHVARARRSWRDMGRRAERRTDKRGANKVEFSRGAAQHLPSIQEQLLEIQTVQPILSLMQRFNAMLRRHTTVQLPQQIYQINLEEGFVLFLDGTTRMLTEAEPERAVHCTIDTTLPHLETLLSNPRRAVTLVTLGYMKIDPLPAAFDLGISLDEIIHLDRPKNQKFHG